MPKTGIHWFRHGLRLHDNPALFACQDEVERFIPIFIFDGKSAGLELCGYNRLRFLLQSLKDLESQFAKNEINFMCFYGQPHEVLENLIKEWHVTVISFEKDPEAVWKQRDDLVKEMCKKNKIQVIERSSHTLYDPEDIHSINYNTVPKTFDIFKDICDKLGLPEKPMDTIDLNELKTRLIKTDNIYVKEKHKVPDIDYFQKEKECQEQEICLFFGGETKALELCKRRVENEKDFFKKGKTNPNLKKPVIFTTEVSLSPYLRFGCLSTRKLYWEIKNCYDQYYVGEEDVNPTEQLLWREYFYQMSYKNDKFDQVDGNSMCFKIPWDYYDESNLFPIWEQGKTGFPWIDACMHQLIQEGWIHHICRNSVAIFLTRGALFQSWHMGLKTFLYYQIDADWSVCSGNWNWISCGDPEEILEDDITFCPVKYGKKVDPYGVYIKKYVKQLENFPIEYIFEPWKAPLHVQEKACCLIGRDYPNPMIDHVDAFKQNNLKLRQFFQTEKKDIFQSFFGNKDVLRPSSFVEYNIFTFEKFLGSDELDDF